MSVDSETNPRGPGLYDKLYPLHENSKSRNFQNLK